MKNGRMAPSSNPMYLVMVVLDVKIVSSMCNSSKVLITINFQKACKDRSIEYYMSENGLIFSSGSIRVKYFKQGKPVFSMERLCNSAFHRSCTFAALINQDSLQIFWRNKAVTRKKIRGRVSKKLVYS
ncbi:hypothetical protein SELMODRAFT_404571 [Selaginella moellendorffii]|uniref:Uncharacterized protein n=1 Tax=Selaginella moellendorffii TaxID=88036 RepID=D8QVR8_SELML|nr:hypothetical protein SELMODRAFT_404571 [Selaginella moellendorffii]